MDRFSRHRPIEVYWDHERRQDVEDLIAEAVWVVLNDCPAMPTMANEFDKKDQRELNDEASVEGAKIAHP